MPRAGGSWQSPAGFMPSKHQRKKSFRCSSILETLRKSLWGDWEGLSALAVADSWVASCSVCARLACASVSARPTEEHAPHRAGGAVGGPPAGSHTVPCS